MKMVKTSVAVGNSVRVELGGSFVDGVGKVLSVGVGVPISTGFGFGG